MKAVLVMDMSETCMDCQFCFEITEEIEACCIICADQNNNSLLRNIEEYYCQERPDWCPLKLMPEKISEEELDKMGTKGYDYGYFDGWNACIDAITGGKMDISFGTVQIRKEIEIRE